MSSSGTGLGYAVRGDHWCCCQSQGTDVWCVGATGATGTGHTCVVFTPEKEGSRNIQMLLKKNQVSRLT